MGFDKQPNKQQIQKSQNQSTQNKYNALFSYRHVDNKEKGRQWATWLAALSKRMTVINP